MIYKLLFIIISFLYINNIYARQGKISGTSNNIIKGTEYPDQTHPPKWIGALYLKGIKAPVCTVEFITHRFILTAAHCIRESIEKYKVQYTTMRSERFPGDIVTERIAISEVYTYPKVDMILGRLVSDYPDPIEPISIYHGYNQSLYDSQPTSVTHFGYGSLGTNYNNTIANEHSILMQLNSQITSAQAGVLVTMQKSSVGSLAWGDSGAPAMLLTNFSGNAQYKLVGTLRGGNDSTNYNVLLTKDILKWIAKTTGRVIFESPIEYQYIRLSGNNDITFSGWGNITLNSTLNVYSENSNSPIASCNQFTQSTGFGLVPQWTCIAKAKSNTSYNEDNAPSGGATYKATIFNNTDKQGEHEIGQDWVLFKASKVGVDVSILHPMAGFEFNTPVGYTYLVEGRGTPGDKLKYLVKRAANYYNPSFLGNTDPCTNPDAKEAIPNTGIWRCRIKVKDRNSLKYKFTVSAKDRSIASKYSPVKVASVVYTVNPKDIPKLTINAPLESERIHYTESNYTAKLSISTNGIARTLKTSNITYIRNNDSLIEQIVLLESQVSGLNVDHFVPRDLAQKEVSGTISALYQASVTINNDESPIATSSVNYYIVGFRTLEISTPAYVSNIFVGAKIIFRGGIFSDNAKPLENPNNWFVDVTYLDKHNTRKTYCTATNISTTYNLTKGQTWECTGGPFNEDFDYPMILDFTAYLKNKTDNEIYAQSGVLINLKPNPVKISQPNS